MAGNFTICVGTVGSGAWLSPDGGESWRRVGKGLGNESRIFGLSVHTREPRTVFAGDNDALYQRRDDRNGVLMLALHQQMHRFTVGTNTTHDNLTILIGHPLRLLIT